MIFNLTLTYAYSLNGEKMLRVVCVSHSDDFELGFVPSIMGCWPDPSLVGPDESLDDENFHPSRFFENSQSNHYVRFAS
jgi:hypothetical protein